MKLISFKTGNKDKIGVLKGKEITEISSSMIQAIKSSNIDKLESLGSYNFEDINVSVPISPSKIVCVGLNYTDHAKELDMDIPEEPIIFIKPSTAAIGHCDNIIYPNNSTQVDYEAELGIVISKEADHVSSNDASDYIGGYTVINDVTARDLQRKDVQWTRAKSFDTFAPIGPCIETELDPMDQNITLKINSKLKQNSNTKNMIFDVYELIEFISNIMTLKAGDIISTGTPPGVGPMNVGDTVEVEIEGIGILKNFLKDDNK
ncbi:MAG: fumarylacetoacetate hydrolase family protein [Methanobacterium sp.]|uniref:fumarylacetoacetate hydrolase family protein n=1 Tax=Methanobacterium sp. TaxID=2164 RepID=UPI003C71C464